MKPGQLKLKAMMNVDEGETIAGMWAAPLIPRVGTYKLLAKRKADGTFEWVHFIHREDGSKKELFRGEVESEERLKDIVSAVNRTLKRIFGPGAQLKIAETDMCTVDGRKFGDTVH